MCELVYVHIGDKLPEYIYESIYQTLNICENVKIYVLLEERHIEYFHSIQYNINSNCIFVIPIETINKSQKLKQYEENIKIRMNEDFWINTTKRFFIIEEFMKIYKISSIFHIENDVMIYMDFEEIKSYIKSDSKDIWMVQDSLERVIPSIMYIPNIKSISMLNDYIIKMTKDVFINDMILLGKYNKKYKLPIFPENDVGIVFDGAAIGQYLGGIDYNNRRKNFGEPGFINETCVFKPNMYSYKFMNIQKNKKTIKKPVVLIDQTKIVKIVNLHIHSKELYKFSSVFNIKEDDIISGEKILKFCDIIICTEDIYIFHKNILNFADCDNIFIIRDFKNVNINVLNEYINVLKKNNISIFVYTHILENFQEYIMDKLIDKEYTIYVHNSDHSFDKTYEKLLNNKNIKKIYAQNIDYQFNEKLHFLPIGLANSMWKHGNIPVMYQVMSKNYYKKKTKDIYININPNTYAYRQIILDDIKTKTKYNISTNKNYREYLEELSEHRFVLCIRGNALESHRCWESLYLGSIPVFINNETTKCSKFLKYYKIMGFPYIEIKGCLSECGLTFDEKLYKEKINTEYIEKMKINYYK